MQRIKTTLVLVCAFLAVCLFTGCDRSERSEDVDIREQARAQSGTDKGAPETELEYRLAATLETGLEELGGIAIDDEDLIYVVGATRGKIMDADGEVLEEWRLPEPASGVGVNGSDHVFVTLRTKVLKYDKSGNQVGSWGTEGRERGQFSVVTDVAVSGVHVYVADAGNRVVHHFDMTGDFIEEIGAKDELSDNPGIICPSPYLDCQVDERGRVHVTNPGRLRVDIYDDTGTLVRHWGKAGTDPERFCGCCNPISICLMSDGRTATAEKGLYRVKVYDRDGKMLAFLGEENFSPRADGMDLATDSQGRLYVADPGDNRVRVFEEVE